jgi:hypothetical protein
MVSYENAPEALRSKFAEGFVFVDIPEKSLEKIKGVQKLGAGYPGLIIGYNVENDAALVLFDILLPTGKAFNIYPVKFLKPIIDEREYAAKFNYDVKRIKDTLKPLGFVFKSSRTFAKGSLQLSSGIHTETSCILVVNSDYARLGRGDMQRLVMQFDPAIAMDLSYVAANDSYLYIFLLTETSPEVIRSTVKDMVNLYNAQVKLAIPLAEAMNMIKTACSYRMLSSDVVAEPGGGKVIQVKFSKHQYFNNINSLGIDLSETNNGLNFREKVPEQLNLPKTDPYMIYIMPQKDKATGKKFLIVRDPQGGDEIFTKNSKSYKTLNEIVSVGNNVPEETANTLNGYNDLTKDGKLMFFKYLLRKYSE